MTQGIAPCFFVANAADAASWYERTLGFSIEKTFGEPAVFAIVAWKGARLMLHEVADQALLAPNGRQPDAFDAYIWVEGIETLYATLTSAGAEITEPLTRRDDYGALEFCVRDPNGYVLAFGQGANDTEA